MRIAVTGSAGRVGRQLVRAARARGHDVLALARPEFDILDPDQLGALPGWAPNVVVNAAAWTDVDGCTRDPSRAMRVNGEAPGPLAAESARIGALTVQLSTNQVFDGAAIEPYTEDAPPSPINAYGESKAAGERAVAKNNRRHLIVRTAWIYGPGKPDFPTKIREAARRATAAGEALRIVDDEFGNPTPAAGLAEAMVLAMERVIASGGPTILHLAGEPAASRYEWAVEILRADGTPARVERISRKDYARPSNTPERAVLSTALSRSLGIPPLAWRESKTDLVARTAPAE